MVNFQQLSQQPQMSPKCQMAANKICTVHVDNIMDTVLIKAVQSDWSVSGL